MKDDGSCEEALVSDRVPSFPFYHALTDTMTAFPQLFIRKQVPEGQGEKHNLSDHGARTLLPHRRGDLGAAQSPDYQAGFW